ncbi:MAG: hypothetical protein HY796_06905 [Elusimicrobia bacterium]|nr:hypothetical protein [Elusimicrobiota bacterium]
MKKIFDIILKLDTYIIAYKKWIFFCIIMLLPVLAVLHYWRPSAAVPQARPADPLWKNYIGAHTAGIVPRKSNVRVEFRNDVFPKEMVGQSASRYIETEPGISGECSVSGTQEITIVPKGDLERGRHYLVRIKGGRIEGLSPNIGDYEFVFQVIEQALEVDLRGLTVSGGDDKMMELGGTILTADAEEPDKVAEVLTASLDGSKLETKWTHDETGKKHDFVISGITRQDNTEKLTLEWDGDKISAKEKGSRELDIPGLGEFKVTEVKPVLGDQQYILVFFSDQLKADQPVRGLVTLNQSGYTVRMENNTVKIYPEKRFIGNITLTLQPGLRNSKGTRLDGQYEAKLFFPSEKPQVRFAGKGLILPENKVLMIPIEAVNIHSVQVTAFKIFNNNIGQFLQTNKLDGADDLQRVGRYLWRKTIPLPSIDADRWQRYNLDATELLQKAPRGIFRLELSINRKNSDYSCAKEDSDIPAAAEDPFRNNDDLRVKEASLWDNYEESENTGDDGEGGGGGGRGGWHDRDNPCKDAYYRFASGVKDARSFIASNIGLLAKSDQKGALLVAASDLATSEPLGGVKLSVLNFQKQEVGSAVTDGDGFAQLALSGAPFYLEARKGDDAGYLKLNGGSVIPVAHFNVGGDDVREGIKGVLYGERDVWRPGDDLHLVFVLEDKAGALPDDHPVTLRLRNPKGQLMQTLTNSRPVGDFYRFSLKTAEEAPTGSWTAEAQVGNRTFTKQLKIETVKPNRLKIEAQFGDEDLYSSKMPVEGKIFSQWLHGAPAPGLKADAEVRLRPVPTRFDRFTDHVFDDPAREFKGEPETVFEGNLDGAGRASFNAELSGRGQAPGKMSAAFRIRVFEGGGDFSVTHLSFPYSPYANYVGVKLPEGDKARGMLLTDIAHKVSIVTLSDRGKPVSLKNVKVALYKMGWKWWWDRSEESLARFAGSDYNEAVKSGVVSTTDGSGTWEFEIKYPTWGRYLLRACDASGGHCSGKVFYIDWPGWAGRAQEEGGAGANVLSFFSDKQEYTAGETAVIQLPEASQGRALVTIENGSRILQRRWLEFNKGKSKFDLSVTAEMSPNVYVSVALIQPHRDKKNDRPMRLYGVIPLIVNDPATMLQPVVQADDQWRPQTKGVVKVSEKDGRPMDYTLAVVDEGLLGLTNFRTPDLHGHFYKKEALGITTWDLYDYVVGAYGAELERLLALGGDEGLEKGPKKEDQRRFPPVVRFLGPFRLDAGKTNTHEVDIPRYMGAVRLMVVAGRKGAYGKADKTVMVKEPLTLLATLPRVIGPDEEITVPVAVFTAEEAVKEVTLAIETDKYFQVQGDKTIILRFDKPGEKMGFFKVKTGALIGKGRIQIAAQSGALQSRSEVFLEVRSPNPPTVKQYNRKLEPGEAWTETVVPHGLEGTNEAMLEVASVPPLNLEKRFKYLIQYPHGCVEQNTSAVFPQLYLSDLVKLDENRKKEIEKNVNAGIERLKSFQASGGGFMYWPNGGDTTDSWASNYAGHFLTEAKEKGYFVPPAMLADWVKYQQSAAQVWTSDGGRDPLDQSYRLYTLALAGEPEVGSMNRLKEEHSLPNAARWQLAAAYKLAGISDAAQMLAEGAGLTTGEYKRPGATYGSAIRDKAVILNCLAVLGRYDDKSLAEDISAELSKPDWQSTQSIAYALMAMARFYGAAGMDSGVEFTYAVGTGIMTKADSGKPILTVPLAKLPQAGAPVQVKNTSSRRLFAAVTVRGVPPAGGETGESNGLSVSVRYTDAKGNPLDVSELAQGSDVTARLTVQNNSGSALDNIALSHLAPSGWEILNSRLDEGEDSEEGPLDYQDIRDDRVYSYFSLKAGAKIELASRFNAAYPGRYYLPGIYAEAMYEAEKNGQTKGKWVTVTRSSK